MSVSLKFNCQLEKHDYVELVIINNHIHLDCYNLDNEDVRNEEVFTTTIVLDKSTAIKLSKELRKQIALLD